MKPVKIGSTLIVFGGQYDRTTQLETILNAVVDAGYEGIESGMPDPELYRKPLADRGLSFVGAHILCLAGLDDPPTMAETLRAVGCRHVLNSGLVSWDKQSADDYRQASETLNNAGRALAEAGIRLHYHNHDFEFRPVEGGEGRSGMDVLLDELDPGCCDLCVDVAWVQIAGLDPAAFLAAHAGMVGYVHLKDHDGTDWVELGDGQVDLAAVMRETEKLPLVDWAMVEQDKTKLDAVQSVKRSRDHLRQLGY
jgi:sugar phosphate isomerase/epimerase